MKKWKCKCDLTSCEINTKCIPAYCIEKRDKVTDWKEVQEPTPKPLSESLAEKGITEYSSRLPKLTVVVFDREDCPEWAQWAGVNQDGTASFFGNVPNRGCSNPRKNYWSYHYSEMKQIPGNFDASDWQNSLIERPEKKLPDWCKVGAWVWCADCRAERKIEKINGNRITVRFPAPDATSYTGDISEFKPARVRPWTFEEAPLHVKTKDDVLTLYFTISDTWEYKASKRIPGAYSLEEVTELIQADGSPCGVLEAEVGK